MPSKDLNLFYFHPGFIHDGMRYIQQSWYEITKSISFCINHSLITGTHDRIIQVHFLPFLGLFDNGMIPYVIGNNL